MTHDEPAAVPPPRSSAWLCTAHLLMHAIAADRSSPVPVCLAYSTEDPYTVYLDSHADTHAQVTWALARDLLGTGIRRRASAGGVSVYPGHGEDADSVYLLLGGHDGTSRAGTSRQGTTLLRARAADTEAFLRWTEHMVPPGREDEYLDLDALIRRLLDHDPEP